MITALLILAAMLVIIGIGGTIIGAIAGDSLCVINLLCGNVSRMVEVLFLILAEVLKNLNE